MLSHLSVSNYAIIQNLELDFNNGFTVITGETGAGKSILLGALSLILGQRADVTILNDKTKKCIVEGTFKLNNSNLINFFKENNLDFEEDTILRREVSANGKSRAFINDTPVGLNILKDLSNQLIDIHSQHQTLLLKENNFQINLIDAFAGNGSDVIDYQRKYDIDYIEFQINEIEKLNLKENEQNELEEEIKLIDNVEIIQNSISESVNILSYDENYSLLALINKIKNNFQKIKSFSDNYNSVYNRLNAVDIEIKDLSLELENLLNNVEINVSDAEYVKNRLNIINNLNLKHHVNSSDELLLILKRFKEKLEEINDKENNLLKYHDEIVSLEKELFKIATVISNKRKSVFEKLIKQIKANLLDLGMPDAKLFIKHSINSNLNILGIDFIQFLFTANKGFEEKEIDKVASGGELSRLMLTFKQILSSQSSFSCILFDEIDTGVSGEIADKMGNIMKKICKLLPLLIYPKLHLKGIRI